MLALALSACQAPEPSTGSTAPGGTGGTQPVVFPGTQPISCVLGCTSTAFEAMKLGNSNQNYASQGIYVENDEWVWFSDREDSYRLNRMKPDGTGVEKYEVTDVTGKNIVGEDLYYVKREGDEWAGRIYRMVPGETDATLVSPIRLNVAGAFMTVDDEIYFTNLDDGDRLYRMKVDGTDLTKMSDVPCWRVNADGGWIFYLLSKGDDQALELHKMRPDGTEDALFLSMADAMFIAYQGCLYYKDDSSHLMRRRYDQAATFEVLSEPVSSFTVDGDTLYYISETTRHLMKVKLDGTDSKELVNEEVIGVQMAGDWLYFMDSQRHWLRIKTDGSGLENAYSLPMVEPDPPGTPAALGLGAVNANLESRAMFAGDDDWIYYAEFGEGILRMKPDGSDQTRIFDHSVNRLNLVGDWIYFIDDDAYRSMARLKIDGSDYGVIRDASVTELIVRDDWIYFIESDGGIYKIKTDGTELAPVYEGMVTGAGEGKATRLNLDGEWLFWSESMDDPWTSKGIYKTKLDGSEQVTLYRERVRSMTVDEGYVYFIPSSENDSENMVKRMKLDGTETETIIPGDTITLTGVYRGWLYYYDGMEEAGLFRALLDGSQKERLVGPGNYVWVHFLGDQIIFYDNGQEAFRVMDLDGSHIRDFITQQSD